MGVVVQYSSSQLTDFTGLLYQDSLSHRHLNLRSGLVDLVDLVDLFDLADLANLADLVDLFYLADLVDQLRSTCEPRIVCTL